MQKQGIEILAQHGFKNSNLDVSREALRCLANALLLCPAARQVFVNLGYAVHAAERLKVYFGLRALFPEELG